MPDSVLQRIEVSSDREDSPLGGLRALSWGLAALRGFGPGRTWADMGSARPVRRFDALRVCFRSGLRRPTPSGPPLRFPTPSEVHRGSPALSRRSFVPSRDRAPCGAWIGTPDGAPSPGLSCPTAHSRNGGPDIHGSGSLRHLVARAGFGYPLRAVHHRSYRRAKRRSTLGLHPSRPCSPPRRYPSRGLCPPDVSCVLPPVSCEIQRRTTSPAGRSSRDGALDSDPVRGRTELPSWGSPLQRSLPDRPGSRL